MVRLYSASSSIHKAPLNPFLVQPTGGAALLAATLFQAYGQSHRSSTLFAHPCIQPTKLALITPHCLFSRKVWLADSFQGIPPVDTARFPADAAHEGMDKLEVLHDNDINTVKGHFKKLNLLNDNIEWLGRLHDGDGAVCV